MKKKTAEHLKDNTPSFIGVLGDYLKTLFSFEGKKDLIDNASGSLGFLVKLLGKPAIDNHFENVKDKMLDEYGFNTYIQSAFRQAARSVQYLKDSMVEDKPLQERLIGLQKDFNLRIQELEKKFTLSVFQPRYHPAVQMIREIVTDALFAMELDQAMVNDFRKHYNDGVDATVAEVFGDNYEAHKEKIKKYLFQENETKLLLDIIENSRIGFTENEDLKYEEAFGRWAGIEERSRNTDHSEGDAMKETDEDDLKKVEVLIEDYFSTDPENHLDKILFLVADFGKGKSVFLKNYAARLAKSYLETGEGYFPVYFNLRSFSSYSSDAQLGVLEDFLLTEYAIKINAGYFKLKRFVFLLDSLDESCDLSKSEVDRVLSSVKRIQNIDKTTVRSNRLIVTSRPFDDVLYGHIYANKPFEIVRDRIRKCHYLALYGFKKSQFNNWISNSLREFAKTAQISEEKDFANTILLALKKKEHFDLHSLLYSSGALGASELRRPIFAYMIYQLILNNISITQVGKVGIYLGFLNLLTKEAKYVNDPGYQTSLQDQFEARNILHDISALWIYEKGKGKQAVLKKADICRLIGGFSTIESDAEVLEAFKKKGFSDIQFLSHSYFGENDNKLHFQHQSFGEILLAEYYLKVFISCALEQSVAMDVVVPMLKVGLPTNQCVSFFAELLQLLKDSVSSQPTQEIIEKRKLLTPLLASIALPTNNRRLNSQSLYYKWYEPGGIDGFTNEIPEHLLRNWCIDKRVLDRIVELCEQILLNQEKFVLSKSSSYTPLIKNEVTLLHNRSYRSSIDIERQLALIAGTSLCSSTEDVFASRFDVFKLVQLIDGNQYDVLKDILIGATIKGSLNEEGELVYGYITGQTFSELDFSNAIFENLVFDRCEFDNCSFDDAILRNVQFDNCRLSGNSFSGVNLSGQVAFENSVFHPFGPLPSTLNDIAYFRLGQGFSERVNPLPDGFEFFVLKGKFPTIKVAREYFREIGFFLKYCFNDQLLSMDEVLAAFDLSDPEIKEVVEAELQEIKNA